MSKENYKNISLSLEKKVAIIKFNREDKLNALNSELIGELGHALIDLDKNSKISVVLIHGSNKAFAAGADIAEMAKKTFSENYRTEFLKNWAPVAKFSKPIIAAVSGYALGGGLELALSCDIIYAADNAKFGQPEITLAILPGIGGTQRLVKAIGKYKAMEMCLTGKMISAKDALNFNLVAEILPEDQILSKTLALADKISQFSLPALRMVKEAINYSFESSLAGGLHFERRLFHAAFALDDQKEGMQAFLEKRKPAFKDQ
ncbi:MAG: enoyl-CoA hydratase/isomerase family protein [SAR324 cluster bacterium]|nr:enoyl-CoA hydratase/isomerase family protein [SAR324 cluster bacterium]